MEKTERTIDATDLLLGRMCTRVAKMALLGETVNIVNCEKAVISGSKADIITEYKRKRQSKDAFKGPYFPRKAERIVKRAIRGMLPYKQPKGRAALERVMCYEGIPAGLKNAKIETFEDADVKNTNIIKRISIKQISGELGR